MTQEQKLVCLLCGRDKFTKRQPHICGKNLRKRKIIWAIKTNLALFKFKKFK